MEALFEQNDLILMEGSIIERIKRESEVEVHPILVNAPLVYDDIGRRQLEFIYNSYMDIAEDANVPFIMMTPTWRTNKERVFSSGIDKRINQECAKFMKGIRERRGEYGKNIFIGGMMGCKYDCYKPEEGLSLEDSEEFHSWQVDQLVDGGVDFIIAETLPNIEEAVGLAHAMSKFDKPYIISFVINRNGAILDGTKLIDATQRIDSVAEKTPFGYSVNCAFPTFLCAESQPKELFQRLCIYQGNSSSLDHCELDESDTLKADSIEVWGNEMIKLNKDYGVKALGGCCGTGVKHLRYIVENY